MDELYQVVGAFANTLATKKPVVVEQMLSAIRADHKILYKNTKFTMEERRHKYAHDLAHLRSEWEKRHAAGDADIHILGYDHEHGHGGHGAHEVHEEQYAAAA